MINRKIRSVHINAGQGAWAATVSMYWYTRPSRRLVGTQVRKLCIDQLQISPADFNYRHDVNMDATHIHFRDRTDAVSVYLTLS